jgi:hypothetical protein
MSTSTSPKPTVRTAFEGLIDYAGLFPPAMLDMASALAEYDECRSGAHAWMLGKFIVPASRIPELLEIYRGSTVLPLSVIVDAGSDARAWFSAADTVFGSIANVASDETRVGVEALEVPLPPLLSERDTYEATIGQCMMLAEKHGLRKLPIYVEVPRDRRFTQLLDNTLAALTRYGLHGKIRCGGVTPEAYPSPEELAAYVSADGIHGRGFKATAGLHHPVRHFNEQAGVTMHGFLNVLFAVALAATRDAQQLTAVIEDTNPEHFRFEDEGLQYAGEVLTLRDLEIAREHFVAYGSCSFSEPADDLIVLSILPKA